MNERDAFLEAATVAVRLLRSPEVAARWAKPSALAQMSVGGGLADYHGLQDFCHFPGRTPHGEGQFTTDRGNWPAHHPAQPDHSSVIPANLREALSRRISIAIGATAMATNDRIISSTLSRMTGIEPR